MNLALEKYNSTFIYLAFPNASRIGWIWRILSSMFLYGALPMYTSILVTYKINGYCLIVVEQNVSKLVHPQKFRVLGKLKLWWRVWLLYVISSKSQACSWFEQESKNARWLQGTDQLTRILFQHVHIQRPSLKFHTTTVYLQSFRHFV